MKSGGFNLRKWKSNEGSRMKHNQQLNYIIKAIGSDNNENKILGIGWNPDNDSLKYSINFTLQNDVMTKRNIFSIVSKIFGPLGLCPFVIRAKILIQKIWQIKLVWDEVLPQELCNDWIEYQQQLHVLSEIKIKRQVLCDNYKKVSLIGYCDSSMKAYGAVIYLRSENNCGTIFVNFFD